MIDTWVPPQVARTLAGVVGLLVVASAIVGWIARGERAARHGELVARVKSWWIMVAVFATAILLSQTGAIVFFALLSFLALKEYLSLVPTRRADRRVLFWVYLTVPLQFWWVHDRWYNMFLVFIPVWAVLFVASRMVLRGETRDFLRAVGILHWGMLTMVFALSHLAYLLVLPEKQGDMASGAGLLLFVVLLTQLNDVLQFVWGKLLGKRPVLPTVSPKKTVEGLVGGVLTTTALAYVIAPVLTPLSPPHALAAGLMIGLGGFIGDVTISALKRDLGVKDAGTLIPGHGGVLDRIDSLLFTGPVFFHFMKYFYY